MRKRLATGSSPAHTQRDESLPDLRVAGSTSTVIVGHFGATKNTKSDPEATKCFWKTFYVVHTDAGGIQVFDRIAARSFNNAASEELKVSLSARTRDRKPEASE
jgi:hypothetical protein